METQSIRDGPVTKKGVGPRQASQTNAAPNHQTQEPPEPVYINFNPEHCLAQCFGHWQPVDLSCHSRRRQGQPLVPPPTDVSPAVPGPILSDSGWSVVEPFHVRIFIVGGPNSDVTRQWAERLLGTAWIQDTNDDCHAPPDYCGVREPWRPIGPYLDPAMAEASAVIREPVTA